MIFKILDGFHGVIFLKVTNIPDVLRFLLKKVYFCKNNLS